MEDAIEAASDETRTRLLPGGTGITALFFDFKTGGQTNAGTDARVVVRIGERFYVMPGRRTGHDLFERGGVDVIGFPIGPLSTPRAPAIDLDALRRAPIVLSHDGSGKSPSWYVERLSLLVRLALPGDAVLEYKHWTDVGWLDPSGPRGASVVLQQTAPSLLRHRPAEPDAAARQS